MKFKSNFVKFLNKWLIVQNTDARNKILTFFYTVNKQIEGTVTCYAMR